MRSRHLGVGLLLCAALFAQAGEMRSVATEASVLYDAPSLKSRKLFLVRKFTPLEVLVSLDGMSKVREVEGTVAWIDKSHLSERRTVVVVSAQADIRQNPSPSAILLTTAEKWVALDLLELPNAGWVKVRHRDGAVGYVRLSQVWGV